MNVITSWLDDLARLPGVEARRWQPLRHTHASTMLDATELGRALAALGPISGWLTEPARVRELHHEPIALVQRPLAGEFFAPAASGRQRTWQLASLPRDRWSLASHELETCDAHEADTLGEPVSHLHAQESGRRLEYWRLWQPDGEGAPECRIALLAAISGDRK